MYFYNICMTSLVAWNGFFFSFVSFVHALHFSFDFTYN